MDTVSTSTPTPATPATPTVDPAPTTGPEVTPVPIEGEFDQARAATTIAAQRQENKDLLAELKSFRDSAKAKADAEKTDVERLTEQLAAITSELEGERRTGLVAAALAKHGLPETATKYLTGANAAEVDASAAELAKLFGTKGVHTARVPSADVPNALSTDDDDVDAILKRMGR